MTKTTPPAIKSTGEIPAFFFGATNPCICAVGVCTGFCVDSGTVACVSSVGLSWDTTGYGWAIGAVVAGRGFMGCTDGGVIIG